MVKVSTSGLTEKEVRSLMEIMASQASENADDFLKNVSQSRATCKIRIPLRLIDSHCFRGEGATTTMSYAKPTYLNGARSRGTELCFTALGARLASHRSHWKALTCSSTQS